MVIEPRYKKQGEEIPLIVDFRNELVKYPGQSLQASGSNVEVFEKETGIETTGTMLVGFGISGSRLESIIRGGEEGKQYDVKFTGKTQSYKYEECVPLYIEVCT